MADQETSPIFQASSSSLSDVQSDSAMTQIVPTSPGAADVELAASPAPAPATSSSAERSSGAAGARPSPSMSAQPTTPSTPMSRGANSPSIGPSHAGMPSLSRPTSLSSIAMGASAPPHALDRARSLRFRDVSLRRLASVRTMKPNSLPSDSWKKYRDRVATLRHPSKKLEECNTFREHVGYYLFAGERLEHALGKGIEAYLFLFNIVALVMFVIAVDRGSQPTPDLDKGLEYMILAIFLSDYILRIWSADNRFSYIFSFYGFIDFLSWLPDIIELIWDDNVKDLRFVRTFRVARIFRFIQFLGDRKFFFGKISTLELQIVRVAFTLFTLIFVSAGVMVAVEGPQSKTSTFANFGQATYFSVVALTTVGFGDFAPQTTEGRWCTTLFILSAILTIPPQAAQLSQLMKERKRHRSPCDRCGLQTHDWDAIHCKMCGNVVPQAFDNVDLD